MDWNEERERNVQGTMSRGPRGEAAYGYDSDYGSSTHYRNEYEGEQSQRGEGQQYERVKAMATQGMVRAAEKKAQWRRIQRDKNPADKSRRRRPKGNWHGGD